MSDSGVSSGLSDADLIMQLACLEEEEEKNLEDSDLQMGDIYPSTSDFDGSNSMNQQLDESTFFENASLGAPQIGMKTPVGSLVSTGISGELQALDDFEKELGLMEPSGRSSPSRIEPLIDPSVAKIPTGDVISESREKKDRLKPAISGLGGAAERIDTKINGNTNNVEVDDDLDEIEKYLQSLTPK